MWSLRVFGKEKLFRPPFTHDKGSSNGNLSFPIMISFYGNSFLTLSDSTLSTSFYKYNVVVNLLQITVVSLEEPGVITLVLFYPILGPV